MAAAQKVRVTSTGQVPIPSVIRDELGIAPGDEVVLYIDGGRLVLDARQPELLFDEITSRLEAEARAKGITPDMAVPACKEARRQIAAERRACSDDA
jgi:AbrB family looped-hinge helix DNA binding protein